MVDGSLNSKNYYQTAVKNAKATKLTVNPAVLCDVSRVATVHLPKGGYST